MPLTTLGEEAQPGDTAADQVQPVVVFIDTARFADDDAVCI